MSTELPRRINVEFDYWPADTSSIRYVNIVRTAEEQGVSFEEAEVIYDRLLDKIQQALDNVK